MAENVRQEAERAGQLTLGALISVLGVLPPGKPVKLDFQAGSICYPHSYRGFYEQLAFEPDADVRTVAEVLADAEGARGQTFKGYKGGDFRMTGTTMVWVAEYSYCGRRIVGVEDGPDAVTIRTAPYED